MPTMLESKAVAVDSVNDDADDTVGPVETFRSELIELNEDTVRAFLELTDLPAEMEHCRIERIEWEKKALEERVEADEARTASGSPVQRGD
ncbi:hypothetical protein GSI_14525 [Ganoderma sinense ZZ0214-1]|uniref:Uncharacterized protein n=1 Tax=Ganoderma sinense ZZ0214-1 TaxID=1077348 RepID=A0A2G8RNY6_9APHY|nr:hypothetical protein GSI_14525 [Ganoderma sinense ZZ0214-1]